jgi:uncharacterized protein (DUF983 family)
MSALQRDDNDTARSSRSLTVALARAARLRCPVCGVGHLFLGWLSMPPCCSHCRFRFERGPGYWLGSIYVNYGLTAILVTAGYFILFFTDALPQQTVFWLLIAFIPIFSFFFFRFARSIWIGLDVYFDPVQPTEFENEMS